MLANHPYFKKYGKYVDQFRDSPDNKAAPTLVGIFTTVICVPVLLAVYFWYIYTTNGTVYNTTLVKAFDSEWSGSIQCNAPGGCWFAAVDSYYNCDAYNADELIQFVPFGDQWQFQSVGTSGVLFSDNSNLNNPDAYALLMVASVNMTALQLGFNATLPTQKLWVASFDQIYLGQKLTTKGGVAVTYVGNSDNAVDYDIVGSNDQYSIQMTMSISSLEDQVNPSVQNDEDYSGDLGVTLTNYIGPTFTLNRDLIGSCASQGYNAVTQQGVFNASHMMCSGDMGCVTASIVIDPVVTSTTIRKEYTLTALFAQVGGNASNAIVLLGALLTAYHYLLQKFGKHQEDQNRVSPITADEETGTGSKTVAVSPKKPLDS